MTKRITSQPVDSQPKYEFNISVMRPGYMLDNDRLAIKPRTAAKLDPDQFLRFAAEVWAVALKIKHDRAQMELPLGGQVEKE